MVFIRGEFVVYARKYCSVELGKSVRGNSILLLLPASPRPLPSTSLPDLQPHPSTLITSKTHNSLYSYMNCYLYLRRQEVRISNVINNYFRLVQNILPSNFFSKLKIYKTIILTSTLYGCETLSFTLREDHIESVWKQIKLNSMA